MLKPVMPSTNWMPSPPRIDAESFSITSSVRALFAASGSRTSAKITPWSSSGRNDVGVCLNIDQLRPTAAASSRAERPIRRASHTDAFT
jgi:hypothetical protein